jgi:hypothetical protein
MSKQRAIAAARAMPPLDHEYRTEAQKAAGVEFDASKSAAVRWLAAQPEIASLIFKTFAAKERRAIFFDRDSGKWIGSETAEAAGVAPRAPDRSSIARLRKRTNRDDAAVKALMEEGRSDLEICDTLVIAHRTLVRIKARIAKAEEIEL